MSSLGSNISQEQLYYISRSWKGIVVFGVISAWLTVGVIYWSLSFPQSSQSITLTHSERLERLQILIAVMAGVTFLALRFLLPRVRIDEQGVAVRRLLRWRMFTWNELQANYHRELCIGHTLPFTPAIRSHFYENWIWLADADQFQIEQTLTPEGTCTHLPKIAQHFRLPLREYKGELELSKIGLKWKNKDTTTNYGWDDIQQIRTWRGNRNQPAPSCLEIEVGGQNLKADLAQKDLGIETTCRCPSQFHLIRFLRQHVGNKKILDFAIHGELRSVEEAEWRLKDFRMVVWFLSIMSVLTIAAWIFMVVNSDDFDHGLMVALLSRSGLCGIMSLPVLALPFIFYRTYCKPLADYITDQRKAPEQIPGESSI